MKKYAYYNEHDKFAAAWLRELIKDGLIADGEVDERSIEDVTPNDVANFRQCHFFAGIGGWSYALRLAGWPDDGPAVWTGSAPCQPFSDAGKGGGFADERHLWPAFFWLIRQCGPDTIFGEQVSSKAGLAWFDVVSADLEAAGYGVGAFDLCAPSVGAFHIRQRLYFVAHASIEGEREISAGQWRPGEATADIGRRGGSGSVAYTKLKPGRCKTKSTNNSGAEAVRSSNRNGGHSGPSDAVPLGQPAGKRLEKRPGQPGNTGEEQSAVERASGGELADAQHHDGRSEKPGRRPEGRDADGRSGFWSGAQWILCKDGKARPVEPTIQPLASGVPNRVGTLRGAGNAIVPQLAAVFIQAYQEYKEQS